MSQRFIVRVAALLAGLALAGSAGAGPVDLGVLPGDLDSTGIWLAPDGASAVVQSTNYDTGHGSFARWTKQGGLVDLKLPGFRNSNVIYISEDGKMIAGTSIEPGAQAHVWTEQDGLRPLTIPGYAITSVEGPQYDNRHPVTGSPALIVSAAQYAGATLHYFYWRPDTGFHELTPAAGTNEFIMVRSSGDGSTVAATSCSRDASYQLLSCHTFLANTNDFQQHDIGNAPGYPILQLSRITDDGATVVGDACDAQQTTCRAFVWTADTGIVIVDPPSSADEYSIFVGLSTDGSQAFGRSGSWSIPGLEKGIRWSRTTGVTQLVPYSGNSSMNPMEGSPDGSIVAGTFWEQDSGLVGSVIWDGSSAPVFPQRASDTRGVPVMVRDTFVLGYSVGPDAEFYETSQAYLWTRGDGVTWLPQPDGARSSISTTATPDGSTILGLATLANSDQRPVVWNANGATVLASLPGDWGAEGHQISDSGQYVLGDSMNDHSHAVLWNTAQSLDPTPPEIIPTVTGTLGFPYDTWYRSDVHVAWSVTDAESDIASRSGCDETTITQDTEGTTLTCQATSDGGTTIATVTVKRDTVAPVAHTEITIPANKGWYRRGVGVVWVGVDNMSSIDHCDPYLVEPIRVEGRNVSSGPGRCYDRAGNVSADVRATGLNVDLTPPTVTATRSPMPNGAGWNNTPVVVQFSATDALSGVDPDGCVPPVTVASNGADQSVSGECTDVAGNYDFTTVQNINIDTVPPIAAASISPAPNENGWNKTNVTVTFSGTDSLSGSGLAGCSPALVITTEGSALPASGTCSDRAGNISPPSGASVKIDKTPPSATLSVPSNGATYPAGVTIRAAYSCSDGGTAPSGVASCTGAIVTGAPIDTGTPGTKTFSVTAVDKAGNSRTSTATYTVAAAAPAFVLLPNAVSFGSQALNTSAALSVTVTSTGSAPLTLSGVSLGGTNANQFSIANDCSGAVAPGSACSITVTFKPTAAGAKTATLTVNGGSAGTQTVSLSGTGVVAAFTLLPATVGFGNQEVTMASAARTVVLTNTGAVPLPVASMVFAGTNANQFSQTSTCGASVDVGAACSISIVFLPTTAGAKSATLKVTPGGGAAAQSITLTGTGVVPSYTLSATSIAFGSVAVGSSSISTITLTNTSSLPLPLGTPTLSGTYAADYTQTSNCPTTLDGGQFCEIKINFTPSATGARAAKLTVAAGAGAAAQSVNLTGTGIVPTYTLAPASVAFGNIQVGQTSTAKVLTITNNGTLPCRSAASRSAAAIRDSSARPATAPLHSRRARSATST